MIIFKTKGEVQTLKTKAKKNFIDLCTTKPNNQDFGGYMVCVKGRGKPLFFEKAEDMLHEFPEIPSDLKVGPDDLFVFRCTSSLTGIVIKFVC